MAERGIRNGEGARASLSISPGLEGSNLPLNPRAGSARVCTRYVVVAVAIAVAAAVLTGG